MKWPTEFPSAAYESLGSELSRGEYRRYDDRDKLPSALSCVAGFPSTDEYRTTLVQSDTSSMAPPSIGGITPQSDSPVFRVSVIRYDQHAGGEEHFNQDESLIFTDRNRRVWQLYAKDQPQHYEALSTDSGLSAALDVYNLPRASCGPLSDLIEHGRIVDFSTKPPGV